MACIRIRPMSPYDCQTAIHCFHGHYDTFDTPATVAVFRDLDPEAFFVAAQDYRQEVAGVCGAPIGPQNTCFIGLYGVRERSRGLGIGSKLFQRCLQYVGERNAGLYAVPEMLDKYVDRSGFRIRESVSVVNLVGIPKIIDSFESSEDIVPVTKDNRNELIHDSIIGYDQKIHRGEQRRKLLELAIGHPDYSTCVLIADKTKTLKGYGCLRKHSISGRYYIGPLYGDSLEDVRMLAQSLIRMHRKEIQTNGLVWNALDSNPLSIQLAKDFFGLNEIERCERIFTKYPIDIDYRLVYSVFSPSFAV